MAESEVDVYYRSGQVRTGQIRSEGLTWTFRESCCSARLSRAQIPSFTGSSVRDRKNKGGRSKGGGLLTSMVQFI